MWPTKPQTSIICMDALSEPRIVILKISEISDNLQEVSDAFKISDFLPQFIGLLYLFLNECRDIFMHQQIVPEITADEIIDERSDRRAVFAILPAYFFGVQRYFLL